MKKTNILFLFIVLLTSAFFMACNDQTSVPTSSAPTDKALNKITLPAGSVLDSAILSVYEFAGRKSTLINVHRITGAWEEGTVTWNNFGSAFDAGIITSFAPTYHGWHHLDITSVVNSWLNGTYANHGVLLKFSADAEVTQFYSSEFLTIASRPMVTLYYTVNGNQESVVIQRGTNDNIEDAFIWSLNPNNNYGFQELRTLQSLANGNKYSLIKFEVDVETLRDGCTRTQGYWKTHSSFGPSHYDETWSDYEDDAFYLSGQTWVQAMNTKGSGNAYYQLAHQYIAAVLNLAANAAYPTEVAQALSGAETLFNTYTPAQIAALKGDDQIRKDFLELATLLDRYNNGLLGVEHCD